MLHDLGQDEQAREAAQRALAIDQEIGDRLGQGYSLTAVAKALEGSGRYQEAQTAYQEALAVRRDIGQAACAIDNLAHLARLLDGPEAPRF